MQLPKTYPLEITVDHALTVHVDQALCDAAQLQGPPNRQGQTDIVEARRENSRARTDSCPDACSQTG